MTWGSKFGMMWQFEEDAIGISKMPKEKEQCGSHHAVIGHMSRWKAACPNPPPKGGGGKKESVDPAQIPKRLGNGSNARDAPNGQRKGVAFPSETQQSSTL